MGGKLPRAAPPPWAAAASTSGQAGAGTAAAAAAAAAAASDDGGTAEAGPSSAPSLQPAAAAPPAPQRGVLGLPAGTHRAFATRVKGEAARPPASTALLTLLNDERLQRAILVRVLSANKRLQLKDRVAGYPVIYVSLGQLMMRSGQAFFLVNRDGQQVNGAKCPASWWLLQHGNVLTTPTNPLRRTPCPTCFSMQLQWWALAC